MRFVLPAPRRVRVAAALAAAAVLCGCASGPARHTTRHSPVDAGSARDEARDSDGPGANPPPDLAALPDAEPRVEPIRAGGANKPYEALGRSFVPIARDVPFSQRGLASWYGRKFHGRRTASGEVYDMYAMTAAHPTLPIPSYARIRNPANGREVLVRVNDRGPFVAGRIVDLSYAAALKLDLLRGVAPVELERITFDEIRSGAWRDGTNHLAAATAPAATVTPPPTSTLTPTSTSTLTPIPIPIPTPTPTPTPLAATRPVDVPAADVTFAAVAPSPAPAEIAPPSVVAAPPSLVATPMPMTSAASLPDAAAKPAHAGTSAGRGFWVQLGAFRERDGAELFRRRIGADGESAWLEPLLAVFGEAALFRVQAGPYASRDDAEGAAQRARAALGVVPIVVERR